MGSGTRGFGREEALNWYASLGWVHAEVLLHRSRAPAQREGLDESEKAALDYRRFITRWRDCDPALRPAVSAAERALARLTTEATSADKR